MSTLPTAGYYGAVMPADVIQPIGKVLRLCQALVVAQTGDAVYPPAATFESNDERGLGRLVVKQENMPYISVVNTTSTQNVSFDASQAVAEKFIRCGFKYRNADAADLNITLPDVDKFIAMGCKLGDRGQIRVQVDITDTTGGDVITFAVTGNCELYGQPAFTTAAGSARRAGFVLDWKMMDFDGTAVPQIEYILTGGVAQ